MTGLHTDQTGGAHSGRGGMVDKLGSRGNSGSSEIGLLCAMGPTQVSVTKLPKAAFTFQGGDGWAYRSVVAWRAGVAIATQVSDLTWALPGRVERACLPHALSTFSQ